MSESQKDAALREFEPVGDAEALGMLREGGRALAAAMVWTKNQEHVINTHLAVFSESSKTLYVWIPKELDVAAFNSYMKTSGVADCFFSVSLNRANVFFKAEYLGVDEGGLRFKQPEKLFKVQRRNHLRMPIPDGHVVKVEFQDPLFPETMMSKKVMDISAGGLAVLAPETDDSLFQVGLILHKVTFTLRGRKIECEAELRHKRMQKASARTKAGLKLGLLFKGMKPADQQFIAAYVFEESRKFFSKVL